MMMIFVIQKNVHAAADPPGDNHAHGVAVVGDEALTVLLKCHDDVSSGVHGQINRQARPVVSVGLEKKKRGGGENVKANGVGNNIG